jgi:TonB family protein
MNRLQKKCVIVTVGVHLLLLTLLLVGPAFFSPKPKVDDLQILDVIPANLVDAAFNSGVANAAPPPPEPVAPPTPPPPVRVVAPPEPPKVEKVEPVTPPEKLSPDSLKPVDKTTKTEPRKPEISTKLVTRNAPKPSPDNANANANAARARAIRTALKNLNSKLTSGTVVDAPGTGSVAYASYKDALGSLYYDAWTPEGAGNDDANSFVQVTVASDGTVIDARIITPSGDEKMDNSIRRALQRVTSVPPLPDKSKIQQDFTIIFTPKAKRMLE